MSVNAVIVLKTLEETITSMNLKHLTAKIAGGSMITVLLPGTVIVVMKLIEARLLRRMMIDTSCILVDILLNGRQRL